MLCRLHIYIYILPFVCRIITNVEFGAKFASVTALSDLQSCNHSSIHCYRISLHYSNCIVVCSCLICVVSNSVELILDRKDNITSLSLSPAVTIIRYQTAMTSSLSPCSSMHGRWQALFAHMTVDNITSVSSSSSIPLGRSSTAIGVIDSNMYVFSGENRPRIPVDGSVYVFDLVKRSWRRIDASSSSSSLSSSSSTSTDAATQTQSHNDDWPCARVGHAGTACAGRFYILGGRTAYEADATLDDMWYFTPSTSKWKRVNQTTKQDNINNDSNTNHHKPPSLSYHTMTSEGRYLYVFGGCTDDHGRSNGLWRFDTESEQWSCISAPGRNNNDNTSIPCSRGGPALAVHNGVAYVAFGYNGKEELGDLWSIDTNIDTNAQWVKLWSSSSNESNDNRGPAPRSVTDMVVLTNIIGLPGRPALFAFGGEWTPSANGHEGAGEYHDGAWCYDIPGKHWLRVQTTDEQPVARGWFPTTRAIIDGVENVVVFGGFDGNERRNDIYAIALSTTDTNQPVASSNGQDSDDGHLTAADVVRPPPRTTASLTGLTFFIAGGRISCTTVRLCGGQYTFDPVHLLTSDYVVADESDIGSRWTMIAALSGRPIVRTEWLMKAHERDCTAPPTDPTLFALNTGAGERDGLRRYYYNDGAPVGFSISCSSSSVDVDEISQTAAAAAAAAAPHSLTNSAPCPKVIESDISHQACPVHMLCDGCLHVDLYSVPYVGDQLICPLCNTHTWLPWHPHDRRTPALASPGINLKAALDPDEEMDDNSPSTNFMFGIFRRPNRDDEFPFILIGRLSDPALGMRLRRHLYPWLNNRRWRWHPAGVSGRDLELRSLAHGRNINGNIGTQGNFDSLRQERCSAHTLAGAMLHHVELQEAREEVLQSTEKMTGYVRFRGWDEYR